MTVIKSQSVFSAQDRLAWFLHFEKSKNIRHTCKYFHISPSTFYHWKKRYIPGNLLSLRDSASRKPKTAKKTKWNYQTLLLIERFTEHNPDANQKQIRLFLSKQNVQLSASTISRIYQRIKRHKEMYYTYAK